MTDLQIGGVYRLDRSSQYDGIGPIELWDTIERVLCFDRFEVFVDIKLTDGIWIFDELMKKHTFFGRRSARFFEDYAEQVGFSEVSEAVKQFYRFDLPLRISRIKELSWFDPLFENEKQFDLYISKNTSEQWQAQRLQTQSLYINAGGDAGGLVLLNADNGSYFTAAEMLKKGRQVMKPKHKNYNGVGIFRSGTKAGIPVYYVGEYFDRSGFLKKLEDAGIETNI